MLNNKKTNNINCRAHGKRFSNNINWIAVQDQTRLYLHQHKNEQDGTRDEKLEYKMYKKKHCVYF